MSSTSSPSGFNHLRETYGNAGVLKNTNFVCLGGGLSGVAAIPCQDNNIRPSSHTTQPKYLL
jgi:hypothetical protein